MHLKLPVRQGAQRHIFVFIGLIDPNRMALAEGAPPRILPREPHRIAFGNQAAIGQGLPGRPVKPFAAGKHRALGLDHAGQSLVDFQVCGNRCQGAAKAGEQLRLDAGGHIAPRGFRVSRLVKPAPSATKPVGLIGLIAFGRVKFPFEHGVEAQLIMGQPILIDHALRHQTFSVNRADRGMLTDARIHQGLGKSGFIALIMAKPAIAPHIDHHIAAKFHAVIHRQFAGKGHRLGVIAVDVDDRSHDALGHIRRIGRAARELRAGGKTDLIVDNEMDAAAGIIAPDPGKTEAFPNNALPGKGGITVDQNRQYLAELAGANIITDCLGGADLAQHHRIDGFKVAGIGHQTHMDLDAIKFAVGAGAQMIFNIARAADILRIGGAARKFVEDNLVRLGQNIGENVQPPAMGHTIDHFLDPALTAIFDHRLQRRDHRLAAIQAKAFGADEFFAEEFFVLLPAHHGGEDRFFALGGE